MSKGDGSATKNCDQKEAEEVEAEATRLNTMKKGLFRLLKQIISSEAQRKRESSKIISHSISSGGGSAKGGGLSGISGGSSGGLSSPMNLGMGMGK